MQYAGRLRRLQQSLPDRRLDGYLVTHLPNIRYLTGFTGSAAALLLTPETVVFLTDGRYRTQAREEVRNVRISFAKQALIPAAGAWIASVAGQKNKFRFRMGFEASHLTVAERNRLAQACGSEIRLVPAPPLIENLRVIKDDDEVSRMRHAAVLGSRLFESLLPEIRPGVAETDVSASLEYAARKAGAERMSFDTIIAAGPRSAPPHGRASAALIPRSGFVVCDFGVILAGYCSDMTRTVHVGKLSSQLRGMYEAVLEAQQAAVAAVAPGRSVAEIDAAARKALRRRGLVRYFIHSTGHGVGLEIHEPPRLAAGQEDRLQPGMVITIEPGVYVAGKWGVRIEDMVLVTEHGCEVLTSASKDLIPL
ncbi:MAG: aminopeptidase P family protein [Acidobacteriales bacterium]|nr:aminopeptidase P family protein [Terriglobales bacterium]